ncbi:MAG: SRPBCC family protein [Ilumatobacteraceae bacterium]
MTTFSSRNRSVATVPVLPELIWDILSDPDALAQMTPLVDRITTDGNMWSWTLAGISALGVSVAPTFSEHMTFVPTSRIEYRHEPPPGRSERAGASGTYLITQVGDDRSKLHIDITLCVELPLPGFSRRAVERIMAATMQRTGDGFAANLYERLGIDPSTVDVKVLEGAGA